MDPISASILAGASLLGSLGSGIAGAKRQQTQSIMESIAQEGQAKGQAYEQETEQKRAALANLIAAYRSTIGA